MDPCQVGTRPRLCRRLILPGPRTTLILVMGRRQGRTWLPAYRNLMRAGFLLPTLVLSQRLRVILRNQLPPLTPSPLPHHITPPPPSMAARGFPISRTETIVGVR